MNRSTQGHLAMLLFSALVAGSFSLGSMIANRIDPEAVTAVRFGLGALLIGGIALARGGIPREAFVAPWRYVVLGGLFASYFVLMFVGLKTAPPVSTAAVFTLTPVMAGGFGWLLLRQVMTPRTATALTIGAIGALWVIFRGDLAALAALDLGTGEAIYFVGCVAHAVYTPMVARLNRGENAFVFTFGMQVTGFLLLVVWGWTSLLETDWAALTAQDWAIMAYLAVFSTSASFVLLQFAALRLPSAKVMAYTYLTPSWVILWEIALGNGAAPARVLIGVGIAMFALVLLLRDDAVPGRTT